MRLTPISIDGGFLQVLNNQYKNKKAKSIVDLA